NNPADVCCGATCAPGNCCTNAECSGATPACSGHTCIACDVGGNTFHVNPMDGSDASSGSGAAGGTPNAACAFKTLAAALAAVGPNPGPNTQIVVDVTSTLAVPFPGD